MAKVIEFYVPTKFSKRVKVASSAGTGESDRVLSADKEICLRLRV